LRGQKNEAPKKTEPQQKSSQKTKK